VSDVNAPNTPPGIKRIPPRVDTPATATVTGWHIPMLPVTLSIAGGSAANGTATINGGATHDLTSTETVQVRGGTQTTPGNAGNLKLVAHQGTTKLAESAAFSVAAYPTAIGFTFNSILKDASVPAISPGAKFWGATYDLTFTSDSGVNADCDETKVSENILVDTATGAFTGVTPITSNFNVTTAAQTDHHVVGDVSAADMRSTMDSEKSSRMVLHQFFRFACRRTGIAEDKVAGPTVPVSGFKISHWFTVPSCMGSSKYIVHAQKQGFANNGVAAGTVDDTGVKDAEV
jgi:hypothetical protein